MRSICHSVEFEHEVFDLISSRVLRLAARRPLLFVFEDMQWVDRLTLELITLLVSGAEWSG